MSAPRPNGFIRSKLSQKLSELLVKLTALVLKKPNAFNVSINGLKYKGELMTNLDLSANPITFTHPKVIAPIAASLIIQDLTYSAKEPGVYGNNISIEYTIGGTAGAEVVTVVGNAISVQIETAVSTADQIKAKIDAHSAASLLVSAVVSGTGSTAQIAAVAANLALGADQTSVSTNFSLAQSNIYYIQRIRCQKYLFKSKVLAEV